MINTLFKQNTHLSSWDHVLNLLSALILKLHEVCRESNELSGLEGRLKREAHTSLGSLIKQEERGQLSGSILLIKHNLKTSLGQMLLCLSVSLGNTDSFPLPSQAYSASHGPGKASVT